MKTLPGDYDPPRNARYFSFRITRDDGRHEVSIGELSTAELQWVGRVVVAESQARAAARARGVVK